MPNGIIDKKSQLRTQSNIRNNKKFLNDLYY